MMETTGYNTGSVFFAFLGGAAVGVAVALLLAPGSGDETRARITRSFRRQKDRLSHIPPAVRNAYIEASGAAKQAFTETYRQASSSQAEIL